MSAKIDISPEQLEIVQAILRAHLPKGTRAWAFGSRVTWTAKPYSDLDLAVEAAAPLPLRIMGDLQEAFENSDLPWRVDVIDLKSVSPEFRAIVERQKVPADWRETTLGELVDFRNGVNFAQEHEGKGIPILKVKDFGALHHVPTVNLDELDQRKISISDTQLLLKGDVVIMRSNGNRELVGRSLIFGGHTQPMTFSGFCIRARVVNATTSPEYIHYWLRSPQTRARFSREGNGTGINNLSQGFLAQLPMALPELSEQEAIVQILSSLDDKIELNRQMNQTLEALARAVFEDWFVAFGPTRRKMAGETDPATILGGLLPPDAAAPLAPLFPNSIGDNGLPLGWEVKTLGDVVEPRKGRNITKKTVTHGTVPVVAGGLGPAYYHDTANVTGPVITASASGANAGFVRLYNQDIWASDCSYISSEQTEHLFTIYALLSSRQDEIYSMQQGAAQPHIYPSDLKRLAISDAPPAIWQACEELLSPMFEQLASNEQENETLAATRDLLLPKLMSGELRLGGAVE